jgi:hypothetical protein
MLHYLLPHLYYHYLEAGHQNYHPLLLLQFRPLLEM